MNASTTKLQQALKAMSEIYGIELSTVEAIAGLAIEYAAGAHDPGSYPEDGYDVDAAGTFRD
jgi:hypothetical protein